MRDLPKRLTCPKCGRSRTKDRFALRVTKRDGQSLPVLIRRQSWCRDCRG